MYIFLFLLIPSLYFCESQLKGVVYTCICGNYDAIITHTYIRDNWDYIYFTDNQQLLKSGHAQWEMRPLEYAEGNNTRINRWHKLFPHKILKEYYVRLYIDGNVDIPKPNLFDFLDFEVFDDESKKFAINTHKSRNCIYEEAKKVKELKLDFTTIIDEQMATYKKANCPAALGLTENFMLYRRHHDDQVKEVMEEWWWWVFNYSKRDQLSFNFVIWKQNFKIDLFDRQFSRQYNTKGPIRILGHKKTHPKPAE